MSHNVVNRLIEQNLFEHYYQPILDLKNEKLVGGELLLRTVYGSPDYVLQQAKKNNKLYELDTKLIINAINTVPFSQGRLAFLNVFPSTINNPLFIPFIENLIQKKQIKCNDVVFEINEAEKIGDLGLLKERINRLRELGFLIACDDIGNGLMDLTYMLELNINFIKLDRRFSHNLIKSHKKQDLISAVLYFCKLNQIKVILEGIENRETLHLAKELGVDMGQGYYLGIPDKVDRKIDLNT